ncbi:MAG: hypothetical protein LBQ30_01725 [Treponema sp.]|jgi:hypothetical protein|nr:hypothetical protein [Treponema sp.]
MVKTAASTGEYPQYIEKISEYKQLIDKMLKAESKLISELVQSPDLPFKQFDLVEVRLNLASYYMILTGMARSVLKKDNQTALDDARKIITKSIAYLEDMVSHYVDALFTDYEDKLARLEPVSPERRYYVIRKLGLAIKLLENTYGENSRWKWSFVDMEGRCAAVTKNIFDVKNMVVHRDPRSPHYEATVYHLQLIKHLLMQSAERYRERYELSTGAFDDFRMGLNFLSALRRIHILLGESPESEMLKKKIDSWSAKLEADMKRKEEEARLSQETAQKE